MTFLKALAAGIAILAALALRVWSPGLRKSLSDTTISDWLLVAITFGALVVIVALMYAMK